MTRASQTPAGRSGPSISLTEPVEQDKTVTTARKDATNGEESLD